MANLSAIRDWVRQQTLIEEDDWSDGKINNVINQGLRLLTAKFDWPFMLSSATITAVSGTQTYALPSDHAKTHVIFRDGYRRRLREYTASDAWNLYGGDMPESSEADSYFIHKDDIYLVPVPTSSGETYTHHYWTTPSIMANDTDSPPWAEQFHLVLADYAISKAWEREEDFTKAGEANLAWERGLEEMARYYLNRANRSPMVFGETPQRGYARTNMPWLDGV